MSQPATGLGLETQQAQLNRWYDITTPAGPVDWPQMPKMLRSKVRKSEPFVSIYRFRLQKGRKYTFQTEYPADYLTGSACLRGVNPLADSDVYNAPSGSTALILCKHRGFPGGNIKGYVFGRKSNFTVSSKSQHDSAYLVISSEKPNTPFRFRMIDPAENDDFIRKKGGYQLRPERDPYYSWSNVYKKHFWLGYARGEERKSQSGQASNSNTAVSADIKILPGKATYAPDENITIRFSGLPGNQKDWIALVGKGAPANDHGQWFYTQGKSSGSHRFKGLKPGAYEIRVYLDWPRGGYHIAARQPVIVKAAAPVASTPAADRPKPMESKATLDCREQARAFLAAIRNKNYQQARAAMTGEFQALAGDQDLARFRHSLMEFGQYQTVSDTCTRELGDISEAILVLQNRQGQTIMVQFAFIKDRINQCVARWGVQ